MSAAEYDAGLAALRAEWRAEAFPGETVDDWIARTGRRFGARVGAPAVAAPYLRPDGVEMVAIAPGVHVARPAAERLGLVARGPLTRRRLADGGAVEAPTAGLPRTGEASNPHPPPRTPRPVDLEQLADAAGVTVSVVSRLVAETYPPPATGVAPAVAKTARILFGLGAEPASVAADCGISLDEARAIRRAMRGK